MSYINSFAGPSCYLAFVDFHSTVLWAVVVGWVLSVTLHELAHGVVGFFGGDYTIRERGGLTLNPFKYMDPVLSIVLPLFFLLRGHAPLGGGVTYIRRDLLRSKLWETAVSLAGPAMNFALFLCLALPFHPRVGWIHPSRFSNVALWSPTQQFLATMVELQFLVFVINLFPIPPLDGFGAIRPYFDENTQAMLSTPQVFYGGLILLNFLIPPSFIQGIYGLSNSTLAFLGFHSWTIDQIGQAFNKVLFNQ